MLTVTRRALKSTTIGKGAEVGVIVGASIAGLLLSIYIIIIIIIIVRKSTKKATKKQVEEQEHEEHVKPVVAAEGHGVVQEPQVPPREMNTKDTTEQGIPGRRSSDSWVESEICQYKSV